MIYQKIGLSRRGRVARSIKRSNPIQNGCVWSSMMEYIRSWKRWEKRAWVMWDCRDPFRNRNAESMGLRLVGVFSSCWDFDFSSTPINEITNEYKLRKSTRTDQQKRKQTRNTLLIKWFYSWHSSIYIYIYVFVRVIQIDICSRISRHAISLRSYSIFNLLLWSKKFFKKIFLYNNVYLNFSFF